MAANVGVAGGAGGPRRGGGGAGRRALRRFLRHRGAVVGLSILALISLVAIFAPLVSWHDPNVTNTKLQYTPPNSTFLIGADRLGRDLWARLLYAGRVSLSVGIAAALVSTGIGLILGLIAGVFGGWVD